MGVRGRAGRADAGPSLLREVSVQRIHNFWKLSWTGQNVQVVPERIQECSPLIDLVENTDARNETRKEKTGVTG